MNWPRPVRMVGLGSPHGQDALGWLIVADVQRGLKDISGIEFHRLGGAQDLLHLLDGTGTLILVDAVASGLPPGTMHQLSWPTDRLESIRSFSSHGISLAETMKLAETLGILPQATEICGIEMLPTAGEAGTSVVTKACRDLSEILAKRFSCPE